MHCENPNCHAEFNPRERAQVVAGLCNEILVKTECPNCRMSYYTYTGLWIASINTTATPAATGNAS